MAIDVSTIDSVLAYLKQEAERFDTPPRVLLQGALRGVEQIRLEEPARAQPEHRPGWVRGMEPAAV
jgi:hypothetical protein